MRSKAALTGIAHSYGTLVLADAIDRGASFDRAVLGGSPGLRVSPDDTRDRAKLYGLSAPGEPVATLNYVGWFPYDPYGVGPCGIWNPTRRASSRSPATRLLPIWSFSLYNMAAVTAGRNP
jgi:hypothetical protein